MRACRPLDRAPGRARSGPPGASYPRIGPRSATRWSSSGRCLSCARSGAAMRSREGSPFPHASHDEIGRAFEPARLLAGHFVGQPAFREQPAHLFDSEEVLLGNEEPVFHLRLNKRIVITNVGGVSQPLAQLRESSERLQYKLLCGFRQAQAGMPYCLVGESERGLEVD